MTNAETILRSTFPTTVVTGTDMVKGMYGKRQVVISYDKKEDAFNVWAFTLRGVNFTKEVKENGVYLANLKQTILALK